jgi:hypothetical protein
MKTSSRSNGTQLWSAAMSPSYPRGDKTSGDIGEGSGPRFYNS